MAKTMAEVLAEHEMDYTYDGKQTGCSCGHWQARGPVSAHADHAAHLAAALSAAGYGLVADAKRSLELAALLAYEAVEASTIEQARAEALEEAADSLGRPDAYPNAYAKGVQLWLRARAADIREGDNNE